MRSRGHGRRWVSAALLPVALLCLAAGPASGASWVEVRTGSFVVRTDAGPERGLEVARALEEIDAALESTLPAAAARKEPLPVLAFARSRDFLRLLPDYRATAGGAAAVAAAYFSGSTSDEIVLRLDAQGVSPSSVVYHEAVHSFTRRLLPGLPAWLEEGLAELWSTAAISQARPEGFGRVVLGREHRPHLRRLRREGLVGLDTLLSFERTTPIERERAARLYASAWAFSHYLVLGREAAGAGWEEIWRRFARYVEQNRRLGDPLGPFEAELGPIEAVAAAVSGALAAEPLPSRSWTFALTPFEAEIRPLREAEVETLLGGFLVRRGAVEPARAHLAAALSAEPDLAPALEAMGLLAYLEGDHRRAVSLLDRTLAEGTADATVRHLVLATLLRESGPDRDPADAVRVIGRVVSLRPDLAPAWIQLAQTYAGRAAPWELVQRACEEAVASRPDSAWFRLLLARSLLVGGRAGEASREARSATRLAIRADDPVIANNVCWYGAVGGLATEVMPACEHAVRLDPSRGLYRDSRAVARALAGDLDGAAEDLRAFLASPDGTEPALRDERHGWLESLEAAEMPFGPAVLERLCDLPF